MNVPGWIGRGISTRCGTEGVENGSLTSVKDPEGDKLDLDDGRDDTDPTSSAGNGSQHPDGKK